MTPPTFTITPTPPYDFDLTAGYVAYFRGRYATDVYEDGVYRRLLDLGDTLALASVTSGGTPEAPSLDVVLHGDSLTEGASERARAQLEWILGVDQGLLPFYRMAESDPHLAQLATEMRGLHTPHTVSAYEALILAILGQQISTHVARMLRTLLIETYGPSAEQDGEIYHAFPRPEVLAEVGPEALRSIKFSARKSEYIIDIASRVASGELDLEGLRDRPVDEVVKSLTAIRGVGPWTAHWLMIRALGHPDAFPYGDLALQRTLGLLVNGGTPLSAEDSLKYSERWAPHRSLVTTYLFGAVRSGRVESLAAAGQVGP